jgi:hypothetical protein
MNPRFWRDYDPELNAMHYRAAMALMLGELMTGVGRPYK